MGLLAVIGGSGFQRLAALGGVQTSVPQTPYGPVSAPIVRGRLGAREILFLPRHGADHRLPPHRINYRANLWALHAEGAARVVGLAAVGGISDGFGPRAFAVPDQIVDYTWGRDHTYCDGDSGAVLHVDFTEPYSPTLRSSLLRACAAAGVASAARATYGATQGPRLETAAEIARLERDGCDLVGMTGMPEAALARELGLAYASLAFVVNWAAGKGQGGIAMSEIGEHLGWCAGRVERVLAALVQAD
jgi:5'-methylthioinosine phosphorylase